MLATDPDADRLGVYVKDDKSGEYIPLTGNMSGALLCDYVLSQKQANGQLPKDGQVVKSIVTTNLVDAVAAHYGAELIEVLTGFKWIGKQILKNEQEGKGTYLFGMEESYGCLIGSYARDKDAISATAALCEAAAYYKEKGMTLWDAMIAMYEKYGYYHNKTISLSYPGAEGAAKMAGIMAGLRENPPAELAGSKVEAVVDYNTCVNGLPKANVIEFDLEGGNKGIVRPSGTEPKIKLYIFAKGADAAEADAALDAIEESGRKLLA